MQEQTFKLKTQMVLEGDTGAEGMVLIDGHSGSMCACNTSAAAMLNLLKHGASQAELARELARKFAITDDRARVDARGFLQSLSAMGAIEMVDTAETSLPEWNGDTKTQPA